jgi:hypothetical protein
MLSDLKKDEIGKNCRLKINAIARNIFITRLLVLFLVRRNPCSNGFSIPQSPSEGGIGARPEPD